MAIRGNNDRGDWARGFPDVLELRVNGFKVQVIHNLNEIADDPAVLGIHAVISGHSHKPTIVKREQVLFVNPGSAGPRRFKLPVAVGEIRFNAMGLSARIIDLQI